MTKIATGQALQDAREIWRELARACPHDLHLPIELERLEARVDLCLPITRAQLAGAYTACLSSTIRPDLLRERIAALGTPPSEKLTLEVGIVWAALLFPPVIKGSHRRCLLDEFSAITRSSNFSLIDPVSLSQNQNRQSTSPMDQRAQVIGELLTLIVVLSEANEGRNALAGLLEEELNAVNDGAEG